MTGQAASAVRPAAPNPLRFAYLLPTGRCNLTCEGCYATLEQFGRHTKHGELSTEQYAEIIRECVALGVRCFDISGGEPFLRRDLVALCREIKAHPDTEIWLVNNGTLARPDQLAALAGLVDRFVVSLDAAEPERHDAIRGMRGGFAKGLETLRRARDLGFPEVGVNVLLMDENRDQVDGLFALCRDEALDRLTVLTFRDVSENGSAYEAVPPVDALQAIWRRAEAFAAANPAPARIDLVAPSFLYPEAMAFHRGLDAALRPRFTMHMPNLRGYSAFNTAVVIKPFGTVTGDTSMINDATFDLGPARLGLEAVWTEGSRDWRARLKEREAALRAQAPCNTCARWHYCRGGCPAAARQQWGDYRAYDRTCDPFRAGNAF